MGVDQGGGGEGGSTNKTQYIKSKRIKYFFSGAKTKYLVS